jgi:Zn-dependent protease with chaperone function
MKVGEIESGKSTRLGELSGQAPDKEEILRSPQPWLWMLALFLIVPCAGAGAAPFATLQAERAALDVRLTADLAAHGPEAVDLFKQAVAAGERDDNQQARDLYARLAGLVPGFTPALRRQAGCELRLGHHPQAVLLARRAVELEATPDNLESLALILASGDGTTSAPAPDVQEAVSLARRAISLAPDSLYAEVALAQAAVASQDLALLNEASDSLVRLAPDEPQGHFFRAIAQAYRGELSAAEETLEIARKKGLPAEQAESLLQGIRAARPWYLRILPPLFWTLGIWLGSLLLLLLLGTLLSQAALRAAGRVPDQASGSAQGLDARLRGLYKAVLWLSCLYYWLSMPIVVLLVLTLGGGILYAVFAIGHIPIKLVVLVVIAVGVTLASIVRGLFARGRDVDPGLRLAPGEEPRLAGLLNEVAGRIGTRPVDTVYLTPGTDLAVMERGGVLSQMKGGSERCLILGVGALEGLKIGPFKAILAHEYGHFSNRDTAGGGLALAVRRSLLTTAHHLAAGGAAAWYNPAWLFLLGFEKVFLRISQGASRLQEVLADRWAAFTYGAKSFEAGLTHVIRRSVLFDAHVKAAMSEVVRSKRPLPNLYTYQPAAAVVNDNDIEWAIREALNREPSPYDSHPAPMDRFRWVQAIGGGSEHSAADEEELWTLFRDREAVERLLTVQVRANVAANHGIQIPGEEKSA